MEKMSFGQFLASCRAKKGLTQKELADKLYVSESAVSKWEKDRRRPDLDLVSRLSEIFGITETELIRASVDVTRIKEKKQARNFRIINSVYNLILYIGFAIALLTCFIVNLAVSHKLSWFFIVLTSLFLSAVILILPQFVKKHRLIIIPLSWLVSLYLLLAVVCVYVGGDWFFIPFFALLLAYSIVFTPLLIHHYLPLKVKRHNLLLSICINSTILLLMLFIIDIYTWKNDIMPFSWFFNLGMPITFYWLIPVSLSILALKYIKINWAFRTSLLILFWLAAILVFDCVITNILGVSSENEQFWNANFSDWSTEALISANVNLIVYLSSLFISIAFAVVGFVLFKRRAVKSIDDNKITTIKG